MSRYLLFFGCVLLGVLPCKSQDVIVLHKENKLTGRVLWEKSRGGSLFYPSAVSSGDSLLLFVPRRRVEYVLSDGDRRMLYRGKTRGWQPWRGRTFNEVPQHRIRLLRLVFLFVEHDSRRLVDRCVGDADDESQ